jgi:hypothetical protein
MTIKLLAILVLVLLTTPALARDESGICGDYFRLTPKELAAKTKRIYRDAFRAEALRGGALSDAVACMVRAVEEIRPLVIDVCQTGGFDEELEQFYRERVLFSIEECLPFTPAEDEEDDDLPPIEDFPFPG